MKKFKTIILIIFQVYLVFPSFAQDPNYTQFFNNQTYYNPAYTGIYEGLRARFSFRDLYPALPYDFKSYHFDADLGDRGLPGAGGVGLFVNTDNEGIGFIRNLNLGMSLSVRIPFSKQSICQIGMKASWLQKSVNWDDFIFSDRLSARYGDIYQSTFIRPDQNVRNMADFGVGGLVQFGDDPGTLWGTIGLGVDHLFEPDQSFLQTAKAPLPRKWVLHADMVYAIGQTSGFHRMEDNALYLNPAVVYQSQGGLNALQVGLNMSKYGIIGGLWYKGSFGSYNNSSLAFVAGYGALISNIGIRFTYSYDMQMAGALQGTGGAHEISLILDLSDKGFITGRVGLGKPNTYKANNPWKCEAF